MNVDIQITALAKGFGSHQVLRDVNLTVPRGQTFAFLGRNAEGKTTTIRMMLGLLKPTGGSIRVLGLDPTKDAMEIRRRVGYLAEDQQMWGWMTVAQIIRFMAPFYPNWDAAYAEQLLDDFALPAGQKIRRLSKGQNIRLGLLLALAHRPRLVILDDPTLGLDPIMRKQLLRDIVDHLQTTGVTVFFSSHLLYEVEPVADQVAILHEGRIIKQAQTEALRAQVKRLIFPADADVSLPDVGILDVQQSGRRKAVIVEDADAALTMCSPTEVIDLNLDEIFEAYVAGRRESGSPGNPGAESLENVA